MVPTVRQHPGTPITTNNKQNPFTKPSTVAGRRTSKKSVKKAAPKTGVHGFGTVAGNAVSTSSKSTGVHGFGGVSGKATARKVRKTGFKKMKSGGHRLSGSTESAAGDEVY